MLKTIVPAALAFSDGVPYSAAYDDIYHSADGGAQQARHVFLGGCGLPGAWAGRANFVILETGFGIGLNFLATWAAWRDDPARPARLHYLAVEKHPFRVDDLARLHARWPEFDDLAHELRAHWPTLTPGFHRLALAGGRIQLTLMLGEADDCLAETRAAVDAFYLDGFAPDRNADLWTPTVFAALARLARPGATAASYTVAAPVRQGLAAAGFAVVKRAGHGRKRHCLAARLDRGVESAAPTAPRHVAVVGAGVAGTAVAHALASRGVAVTLVERADAPAQGASGNPLAVFRPLISRDDLAATRLTRAAFLHDLRAWTALGEGVRWSRCGVLHLARDAVAAGRQRAALAVAAPPAGYARWVDAAEARQLANWPIDSPGVFYPDAGWVAPQSLCLAWLGHRDIGVLGGCEIASLRTGAGGWQLLDRSGAVSVDADAVVLANARDAAALAPEQHWPIHAVRGQLTLLPPGSLPEIGRVIAGEGYVAPGERPVVGATYEHDDERTQPDSVSDRANLVRLDALLPGAAARIDPGALAARASLRATLADRMPLLGAASGAPGLYVAAAYASRGVVWAALLGEALADLMTAQPSPLEAAILDAIAPDRFARRRGNRR